MYVNRPLARGALVRHSINIHRVGRDERRDFQLSVSGYEKRVESTEETFQRRLLDLALVAVVVDAIP